MKTAQVFGILHISCYLRPYNLFQHVIINTTFEICNQLNFCPLPPRKKKKSVCLLNLVEVFETVLKSVNSSELKSIISFYRAKIEILD